MCTMGDIALCSEKNEDLLYKLFGKNAELLIDHAWGWEPCTVADIKAYKPSTSSISTGQVLACPYTADKARLVVREMADQLLAVMPNAALEGFVAMPVSFVNRNNTALSSPLGRLLAESMYYEFNQRGFPTREYRLSGVISSVGGKNDLALAANQLTPLKGQKWAALLVGTYLVDKDATFVNARLVRASDGLVLRTAQLVLVNTPIISRLLSNAPRDSKGNPIPVLYPPLYQTVNQGSLTITQGR